MDDPQVERFLERLQQDRAMGQEYQSALAGAMESAVTATIQQVAERHGFRFSAEAVRAHLERRAAELDEEQLNAVAGGVGVRGSARSNLGGSAGSAQSTRSLLDNPLVLAGIVAAAIAVPLAINNDDAS